MPWNMNDYPTSMKNLAPLIRKSDRYWQCVACGWLP